MKRQISKENRERAIRATQALDNYKTICLGETGVLGQEDITDLLTDIRHLCEIFNGIFDFKNAVNSSLRHFKAERNGEI